ncbi:zinc finger protein 414 [Menidia menidia]
MSAAMMSTSSTILGQTSEHENPGPRRTPCPLHGCKRMYTDPSALESHLRDHEIPAQSIPGKMLLCSTTGCSGSFPSMHKLMEHMRHHHKPNIYFQCESCRTKLRSYRNLLGHLHTCSKVPRGKPRAAEPAPPQATDQQPPPLGSASPGHDLPFHTTGPHGLGPADPPVFAPPVTPLSETLPSMPVPPQLPETAYLPLMRSEGPGGPPCPNFAAPGAVDTAAVIHSPQQVQLGLPEAVPSASPLGSAAVWKKNQGVSCSRRVLWEHTRGRYTCVQCGHIVTNRKEMTQHIKVFHSASLPMDATDSSATDTQG